jgi:hypothetical protein
VIDFDDNRTVIEDFDVLADHDPIRERPVRPDREAHGGIPKWKPASFESPMPSRCQNCAVNAESRGDDSPTLLTANNAATATGRPAMR